MRYLIVALAIVAAACSAAAETVVEAVPPDEVDWLMVTHGRDIISLVDEMKEEGVAFSEAFADVLQTDDAAVRAVYDHLLERSGIEVTSGTPRVADDGSRIMIPWMWSGLNQATGEFSTVVGASIFVINDGAIVDEMAIYDPGPWATPPDPFLKPVG